MTWQDAVRFFAPLVISAKVPKLIPAIPYIADAVTKSEELNGTGPQKLAAAIAIANDYIVVHNTLKPGAIDQEATDLAITSAIETVVKVANAITKH